MTWVNNSRDNDTIKVELTGISSCRTRAGPLNRRTGIQTQTFSSVETGPQVRKEYTLYVAIR